MTHHDDTPTEAPDLVGLLAGELSRAATVDAARHLDDCPDCTAQLVDLVVAHAALRSSVRVRRRLDEGADADEAASDVTYAPLGVPPVGSPGPEGDLPPLPPLAPLDDGPPADAAGRVGAPARRRRGWHRPAAVAAVVVVAFGVALGAVALRHPPSAPTEVASAALRPVTAPSGTSGEVAVFASGTTRSLTVDAAHLPTPAPQRFYEVWLLDPSTKKMLPMGVLSPAGRGSYSVAAPIMDGYSAVDISLQANDGDPAHSRTSVLRAYL